MDEVPAEGEGFVGDHHADKVVPDRVFAARGKGGGKETVLANLHGTPIELAPEVAVLEPARFDLERFCQNGDAGFDRRAGALLFGAPCPVETFAFFRSGGRESEEDEGQGVTHGARIAERRRTPESNRSVCGGGVEQ